MQRSFVLLVPFLAVACTQFGGFQGRVVDGLTGKPIEGFRVVARSQGAPSVECGLFEATTGADGTYKYDKLCVGIEYAVSPAEKDHYVTDLPKANVQAGQVASAPGDMKAWLLPPDIGMFVFAGGTYTPLRANADVKRVFLWESQETARMPATLPKSEPQVAPDAWLVLQGDRYLEKIRFLPLIKSGERKFGKKGEEEITEPWHYVGLEFTSDTEYKRVEATIDPSKVVDLSAGESRIRFIRGDAVPPGHYAALADMDRRMTILTFGPSAKALGEE